MSNIRTIVKEGKSPGKKIVVLAGVHGDEVCGVKAFDDLIDKLEIKKGKVTFIYANLEAQKQKKRFVEANLNRCFLDEQPEDVKGKLEAETAKEILPYLNEADVLLDLHSSKSSDSLKYIICEKDCLDLISALEPKTVLFGIDDVDKGGSDGYMFNKGKPGICVECGLHDSEDSIETAKNSILNLLKKLELIEGDFETFDNKEIFRTDYRYKNKNGPFKFVDWFKDFQEIKEDTVVGHDGDEEVIVKKGKYFLFPDEPKKIGSECFIVLDKVK
jgi:succinylglutamate desuccinylase